jgi:hypothetical protein
MVDWKGVIGYWQSICDIMFANIRQIEMSGSLPYAAYVYNTTIHIHTTTEYTPFELVYGFKSEMPLALREAPSVQYKYDVYLTELRGKLESAHEIDKN